MDEMGLVGMYIYIYIYIYTCVYVCMGWGHMGKMWGRVGWVGTV